jgi:acetylornithine deacetylase/succinyl-diaminopimelate desuccinylase-like protein
MLQVRPEIRATVLAVATMALGLAAQDGSVPPDSLLKDATVEAAMEAVKVTESQTIEDQIHFCGVAAPSLKEQARRDLMQRSFEQLGLENVRVDRAGNLLGERPGTTAGRPHLLMSAHLDTVFPEGTDVTVRRSGLTLYGPGIGDNCRGLAVLVAVVRALRQARVRTARPITFAATVGEEGLGDLRGVKELFGVASGSVPSVPAVERFVSIDGAGLGVANVGVGSRRYRVTFRGPGGHSFAAFGRVSPIGAMGRAIARITEFRPPISPKTTFNVGRVGGGISVNSIASEAWMEIDLRSSNEGALRSIEARLHDAVADAVRDENARWGTRQALTVVTERVGDRPAGFTPASSTIVRTVAAVHNVLNLPFALSESSTDSNIPMSLRIPAITIGGGGRGSEAHAVTESFDATDSWIGTQRALLLTIALAQ